MAEHDVRRPGVDYTELAAGIDDMREALRAMVRGLMTDGFTEEQARAIIAGILGVKPKPTGESDD